MREGPVCPTLFYLQPSSLWEVGGPFSGATPHPPAPGGLIYQGAFLGWGPGVGDKIF